MELLRSAFNAAPPVKIMVNIGCLFDIPTGHYIKGRRGESILNGGLGMLTGVVGIGNNFKTTLMRYMMLRAMARMFTKTLKSTGSSYDTEVNVHEWRYERILARIEEFAGEDVLSTGRWVITDKTMHTGTEWYKLYKQFMEGKVKNATKIMVDTPFWNRDRTGPLRMLMPTFQDVDSFTEFETDDVEEMQNKNDLGDSGGNTIHMRQGLAKLRFLMAAPRLNGGSGDYLLMTAHLGKESTMQNAGPGGMVPIVKNIHLKNGDKIKGTTDKFMFITNNCWHCYNAKPFTAKDLDGPEYPRNSDDRLRMDPDLMLVQVKQLRGKSGPSGMALQILISQEEGVLPSLTEFHHIKEMDRYGLEGSNVSYSLSLYPECKISRTTVREKIDSDAALRRALNITSEMCQMSYLWHDLDEKYVCTPKQLYDDLKAKGYDWNVLLNTRGWWSLEEDHPIPFLSTMDLLRMRAGEYHPYWMKPLKGGEQATATAKVEASKAIAQAKRKSGKLDEIQQEAEDLMAQLRSVALEDDE